MAPQGGRAAGGLPLGAVVHVPSRPAHPREAGRLDRPARPGDPRPDLGLPDPRADGGARRRGGAAGDQRLRRRRRRARSRPTPSSPATARRRAAAGSTAGVYADERQPGRSPQAAARSRTGRRRVGLGLAGEPPDPLQPRLGRPGRPAVVGAQALRLVGRRGRKWTGQDVPDFVRRQGAVVLRPPDGAKGRTALRGDEPFVMQPDGRGWLFAPTGLTDGPLPTHYEPKESPVAQRRLRPAGEPDAPGASHRPENRYNPRREPGASLPLRDDAPTGSTEHHTAGGDVAHTAPPGRARARDVRRGLTRSWPPSAGSSTTAGRRSSRARTAIEARVMVTERIPDSRSTAGGAIRSACPTTGAGAGWRTATRRTTCCRWRSTRTSTSRSSSRPPATCGPAAGRAGRRCWSWLPITGGGPRVAVRISRSFWSSARAHARTAAR